MYLASRVMVADELLRQIWELEEGQADLKREISKLVLSAEDLKQAICDGEPPSVSENADASTELHEFLAMAPRSRSSATSFPNNGSKGKTVFRMR